MIDYIVKQLETLVNIPSPSGYTKQAIEYVEKEAAALEQDNRRDEAAFAKIRLNVYDIFRTVFTVALSSAGEDKSKAADFFLTKLEQIPKNWHTSLELARQHGNDTKAHIEQIKLDTAAEIRSMFASIREVQA